MNDEHTFDDTLISGYLDGELTQGSEQAVRVHLETCERCRTTAEELRTIKEAAMGTRFEVPEDLQWDETPRSTGSRLAQRAGWLIAGSGW